MIVQPVVEPMDRFAALFEIQWIVGVSCFLYSIFLIKRTLGTNNSEERNLKRTYLINEVPERILAQYLHCKTEIRDYTTTSHLILRLSVYTTTGSTRLSPHCNLRSLRRTRMQIHILENVLPQSRMLKIEFQMRSKNSLFPRHPTSSISTVSW